MSPLLAASARRDDGLDLQGVCQVAAERLEDMNEKIPCTECGAMILPSTAEANGGLCTPCKRGFRKNIEDGKLRHAERKRARENPDLATRHWRWLVREIYQTPVSAENQTYFAVTILEGEVYNGGFHQYFGNSSGGYYADALRGLEEMGAAECRRILLAAKQLLFGEHEVPQMQAPRFEYLDLEETEPAREEELVALDRAFLVEGDRLRDLLLQYAHKHRLFDGF
jgi:hypothetical protein